MTKSSPAGQIVDSTLPRSFQSIKMVGINNLDILGIYACFALSKIFVAKAPVDGFRKCLKENFCIIKGCLIESEINIWHYY